MQHAVVEPGHRLLVPTNDAHTRANLPPFDVMAGVMKV